MSKEKKVEQREKDLNLLIENELKDLPESFREKYGDDIRKKITADYNRKQREESANRMKEKTIAHLKFVKIATDLQNAITENIAEIEKSNKEDLQIERVQNAFADLQKRLTKVFSIIKTEDGNAEDENE